ncbi:MAG: HAD domain-containing protein [Prevotellaceae bacterium]|nr:HAD domain-containing protein [Prevotellaceae bacterium]MDO4932031.1 HAD domain-containing protein [Prevotellaceae bacterium]
MSMNIIFLDFDGVMATASYDMYLVKNHYSECDDNGRVKFDPKCIANLKKMIDETNANVVITSDWKYIDTYESLLTMWKQRKMPGFMIDVTPNVSKHRGTEITRWLEECDVDCNYVIIDDLDAENFTENQQSKLVVVNPWSGLDEEVARRAIIILKSQETK